MINIMKKIFSMSIFIQTKFNVVASKLNMILMIIVCTTCKMSNFLLKENTKLEKYKLKVVNERYELKNQ